MCFYVTIWIVSPNGLLVFYTIGRIIIELNIIVLSVVIILNIWPIIAYSISIYINLNLIFSNTIRTFWQILNIIVNCIR